MFFIIQLFAMSEIDLVIRIKSGQRNAVNELVSRYSHRVMNTCHKFLLNKEDAEDISQEVFLEVFQSIHSFRADAALSTWIYRIAVTKCMDEIKKRKRKKRISSIGKILHLDEVTELLIGSLRTDQNLMQKEQMGHIMKSLDKLPDNQRIAFTLSKIEGYSNKEIAEIMNTNTTQVESFIHRGKQKLTVSLETILKNNFS